MTPDNVVWALFLGWTAIGFVVMPLGIGAADVHRLLNDGLIRRVILAILPVSDALWIAFAATVVYLQAAARHGLATARKWALIILAGSTAAEWVGAQTGFPFGPYRYTANFGWMIGGVLPAAIPLAWLVILLSGRTLVLRLHPTASRMSLALGTAVVAVLTDVNLEWVAWKVRGYWVWYPDRTGTIPNWPPFQNYLSWFVLALGLVFALPPDYTLRTRPVSAFRPTAVLFLMNALFVVVYAVRWRHSGTP